jgi:DNA (cytosine-5)-methyltransferase 1
MYRVVDLFSGAGGLSLGFVQTEKCKVVAAFVNNINAQKTYINNHKDVKMFDDVCKAN